MVQVYRDGQLVCQGGASKPLSSSNSAFCISDCAAGEALYVTGHAVQRSGQNDPDVVPMTGTAYRSNTFTRASFVNGHKSERTDKDA
jgi:hypothetical protein